MAQFSVKLKNTFNHKGTRFEKGIQVEILSKQTSAPNLLSAGKQEIADAFLRKYGLNMDNVYISNNYLEVTKLQYLLGQRNNLLPFSAYKKSK